MIEAALCISHRAIRGEDLRIVPFSNLSLLYYCSLARIKMQLSMWRCQIDVISTELEPRLSASAQDVIRIRSVG
jgi:hypothetical protein